MDILELGAKLLKDNLNSGTSMTGIQQALGQLLGARNGKLDLAALVSQVSSGGNLQSIVTSWLGDGANSSISPAQILSIFGEGKIGEFSKQLGIDREQAAGGLAQALPQMIDKFSSGGNLLQSALGSSGGVGGLLGAAKKLF